MYCTVSVHLYSATHSATPIVETVVDALRARDLEKVSLNIKAADGCKGDAQFDAMNEPRCYVIEGMMKAQQNG